MRIALIGLAALLPAFASADDPKPYVVYQGRAVRAGQAAPAAAVSPGGFSPQANTEAGRTVSAFGTGSIRPGVSGRSSFARPAPAFSRAFRGTSHRRGITGSAPMRAAAPSDSAPPPYAVPGAKIISEGQQPVYSQAAGGGTHSVEGGGFIAMDQAKAHDVGRAPGILRAPPDTPPSATRMGSGGGSGASANGPAPVGTGGGSSGSTGSGGHISGDGNGGNNNQGNNGQGNDGNGNNGGDQNNAISFNPAF